MLASVTLVAPTTSLRSDIAQWLPYGAAVAAHIQTTPGLAAYQLACAVVCIVITTSSLRTSRRLR